MTTTDTGIPSVDPFQDFWMPDYCPACLSSGCDRRATLTEPDGVIWHGGKALICEYRCDGCGHEWQRADLWTAGNFGLKPPSRTAA